MIKYNGGSSFVSYLSHARLRCDSLRLSMSGVFSFCSVHRTVVSDKFFYAHQITIERTGSFITQTPILYIINKLIEKLISSHT